MPLVLCDFVEDPGTVDVLDPSVYLQDINFTEEGTNVEVDGTLARIDRFMSDLVPEDMLAVELPPGEEQTFYMYVDQSPSKIKVAFSVQADRNVDQNADQSLTPIDFKVYFRISCIYLVFRGQRPTNPLRARQRRFFLRI